jgi:hypothetical protein
MPPHGHGVPHLGPPSWMAAAPGALQYPASRTGPAGCGEGQQVTPAMLPASFGADSSRDGRHATAGGSGREDRTFSTGVHAHSWSDGGNARPGGRELQPQASPLPARLPPSSPNHQHGHHCRSSLADMQDHAHFQGAAAQQAQVGLMCRKYRDQKRECRLPLPGAGPCAANMHGPESSTCESVAGRAVEFCAGWTAACDAGVMQMQFMHDVCNPLAMHL